jgi:hypothetical protein
MRYVVPETSAGWLTAIVPPGPDNVIAAGVKVLTSTGSLKVTVACATRLLSVPVGVNAVTCAPCVSIV